MTRNVRRINLAPAYILHHRPYRDTSRILEVITRDHGRLSLFARGVRGPKARLASVLQPFQLLLLSWSGRGEAAQLTAAESADHDPAVPAGSLMGSFYLNELLMKLTTRHDPLPSLFDDYHATVDGLRRGMQTRFAFIGTRMRGVFECRRTREPKVLLPLPPAPV